MESSQNTNHEITLKPDATLTLAELRALYDIRIKEAHHYNTIIWAFPIAYFALIASEVRFLADRPLLLIAAAITNISLWYTFNRHVETKCCIHKALKYTENKLCEVLGQNYMPHFSHLYRPKATELMQFSIGGVTVLLLLFAGYNLQ